MSRVIDVDIDSTETNSSYGSEFAIEYVTGRIDWQCNGETTCGNAKLTSSGNTLLGAQVSDDDESEYNLNVDCSGEYACESVDINLHGPFARDPTTGEDLLRMHIDCSDDNPHVCSKLRLELHGLDLLEDDLSLSASIHTLKLDCDRLHDFLSDGMSCLSQEKEMHMNIRAIGYHRLLLV